MWRKKEMFIKWQVAKSQLHWDGLHKKTILTQWEWTCLHTRRTQQASTQAKETISCFSQSGKKPQHLQCVLNLCLQPHSNSLTIALLTCSFLSPQHLTLKHPASSQSYFPINGPEAYPILHQSRGYLKSRHPWYLHSPHPTVLPRPRSPD